MDSVTVTTNRKGFAMPAIKLSSDGSMVSVNGAKFALNAIQVMTPFAVETVTEVTPKGRAAKGVKRMYAYLRPTVNGVTLILCTYECNATDLRKIADTISKGFDPEGVRRIPCKDIEEALTMAKVFLS
jgi:hypothetical protein